MPKKFFLTFLKHVVSLIFLLGSVSGLGQIWKAFPVSWASFTPSQEYKVAINGKNVMVYSSPIPASFCSFAMDKPVMVVIKILKRDIKWADVRPLSAGIKPLIKSDSTIAFPIEKPGQISIELNGSFKMPLFLFANAPEGNKPDRYDKNVLYFEAGRIHYPGTMILRDNQQVYIEGGAIVVGNIKASRVNHIKICGQGILDGSYDSRFMDSCAVANKTNSAGKLPERRRGINGLILLTECKDVTIEGITLYNSKTWDIVPSLCEHVNINNIKIISDNNSDDGIDVVSTTDISIRDSFIRTKDDCIAIKSFATPQTAESQTDYEQFVSGHLEQGPFYPVDSVTVKNCVFWNGSWGNGIEVGFELAGNVSNVQLIDNDIIHVEGGAAFSVHNARRGVVSKILVDGLRVEYADQKLFDLAIFRSVYSEDGTRVEDEVNKLYLNGVWDNVLTVSEAEKASHAKFRGHIKYITLKNVSVVDGPFPFSVFYGSDIAHQVENVTIENLYVHGKKIRYLADAKIYLENTKNIIIK